MLVVHRNGSDKQRSDGPRVLFFALRMPRRCDIVVLPATLRSVTPHVSTNVSRDNCASMSSLASAGLSNAASKGRDSYSLQKEQKKPPMARGHDREGEESDEHFVIVNSSLARFRFTSVSTAAASIKSFCFPQDQYHPTSPSGASESSMASFSIPVLSIPLYYVLAVFPHGWAISRANKKNMKQHNNQNPKVKCKKYIEGSSMASDAPQASSYHESLKKRLTAKEFEAFERAESCHRNHMENMPLFIAAIFAGLLAESRIGADQVGLSSFVYGWMAIRILYTANYLSTETRVWSYLRSALVSSYSLNLCGIIDVNISTSLELGGRSRFSGGQRLFLVTEEVYKQS